MVVNHPINKDYGHSGHLPIVFFLGFLAMADSNYPKINILNYHNHASWSRDMKFILKDKNLWKIIKGTEVCPGPEKDQIAYNEKA